MVLRKPGNILQIKFNKQAEAFHLVFEEPFIKSYWILTENEIFL